MKKIPLKKIYLLLNVILAIGLLTPFLISRATSHANHPSKPAIHHSIAPHREVLPFTAATAGYKFNLYDSLKLGSLGLDREVFEYALKGFQQMEMTGKLKNNKVISVVDYSQPSYQKRLFVIDLRQFRVLFNTYVAHGMQSGKAVAQYFSNVPESNKSSLGFYQTLDTYMGGNGYSLRLQGVERGINDNANKRAIVMHGAPYVNEGLIRSQGYIGRSWGCPAVPARLSKPIIDKIKNGTCLFIYSPDQKYLAHSRMLNGTFIPGAENKHNS